MMIENVIVDQTVNFIATGFVSFVISKIYITVRGNVNKIKNKPKVEKEKLKLDHLHNHYQEPKVLHNNPSECPICEELLLKKDFVADGMEHELSVVPVPTKLGKVKFETRDDQNILEFFKVITTHTRAHVDSPSVLITLIRNSIGKYHESHVIKEQYKIGDIYFDDFVVNLIVNVVAYIECTEDGIDFDPSEIADAFHYMMIRSDMNNQFFTHNYKSDEMGILVFRLTSIFLENHNVEQLFKFIGVIIADRKRSMDAIIKKISTHTMYTSHALERIRKLDNDKSSDNLNEIIRIANESLEYVKTDDYIEVSNRHRIFPSIMSAVYEKQPDYDFLFNLYKRNANEKLETRKANEGLNRYRSNFLSDPRNFHKLSTKGLSYKPKPNPDANTRYSEE